MMLFCAKLHNFHNYRKIWICSHCTETCEVLSVTQHSSGKLLRVVVMNCDMKQCDEGNDCFHMCLYIGCCKRVVPSFVGNDWDESREKKLVQFWWTCQSIHTTLLSLSESTRAFPCLLYSCQPAALSPLCSVSLALSQSHSYFVSLPSFYHSKALSESGPLHCSFVSPLFVLPLHTCPQPRLLLFFFLFSLTGTLPFHISHLSLTLSFFCSLYFSLFLIGQRHCTGRGEALIRPCAVVPTELCDTWLMQCKSACAFVCVWTFLHWIHIIVLFQGDAGILI